MGKQKKHRTEVMTIKQNIVFKAITEAGEGNRQEADVLRNNIRRRGKWQQLCTREARS